MQFVFIASCNFIYFCHKMIPLRKLWPVIRLNRSWRLYLSTSIPENASESSISDVYERKTPVEHVLLRPGMYIGDIDNKSVETWMYDLTNNHMQRELVNYSPALLKVEYLNLTISILYLSLMSV